MLRMQDPARTHGSRRKRLPAALALASTLLAAAAACGGDEGGSPRSGNTDAEVDPIKVSLLYYGNGENEYDLLWKNGAIAALDKAYPDAYELQEVTDVPFDEQMTQIIDQAFTQGADIVIEDIGGGELTNAACAKHPEGVCIANHPQPEDALPENMAGFIPRIWEMYYLQGVLAGSLTESNEIGWIAPFDVNFDTTYTNSLALGCQSVNPDCVLRRTVINSFLDPAAARAAGKALINEGVDVLAGFQDDTTVQTVAKENDVWTFGLYRPMQDVAGDKYITAGLFQPNIEEHITTVLEQYRDGEVTIEPITLYDPVFDEFGPNVTEEAKKAFEAAQQEVSGRSPFFQGPIYDSDGKLRVKEGESLPDSVPYAQWDWFVEGVEGAN